MNPRSPKPALRTVACLGGALCLAAGAAVIARAQGGDDTKPVPPPPNAIVLFDGRDPSHWVRQGTDRPSPWPVADGAMTSRGGTIESDLTFDDCLLHVEFMVPDMPDARGQGKGNSGVGLQGRYEIQVLDSYLWPVPGKGDCGAVYNQAAPLVNACKPPLRWQTYDISFRAPRYDVAGKQTEKPRVTVLQNGILIQNNVELQGGTGIERQGDDFSKPGPIQLQDHGNAVRYRNIWAVRLPYKGSDDYAPR
jgi:hypothetical protein